MLIFHVTFIELHVSPGLSFRLIFHVTFIQLHAPTGLSFKLIFHVKFIQLHAPPSLSLKLIFHVTFIQLDVSPGLSSKLSFHVTFIVTRPSKLKLKVYLSWYIYKATHLHPPPPKSKLELSTNFRCWNKTFESLSQWWTEKNIVAAKEIWAQLSASLPSHIHTYTSSPILSSSWAQTTDFGCWNKTFESSSRCWTEKNIVAAKEIWAQLSSSLLSHIHTHTSSPILS